MAVGALFYYEEDSTLSVGWPLWSEVGAAWGLDFIYVVDTVNRFERVKKKFAYKTVEDAVNDNLSLQHVYLMPTNSLPSDKEYVFLHHFKHPADNVMYIFGSDFDGLPANLKIRENDKIVTIMTPGHLGSEHPMWQIEVAIVVLYDRWLKLQG
jgi:tRNA(Leu) C34 or U34 (ribose-2'-O)-methylase TrmL